MEALHVGHVAAQAGKSHHGINLVGEKHRFLLVYPLLVGADLDEEVAAADA